MQKHTTIVQPTFSNGWAWACECGAWSNQHPTIEDAKAAADFHAMQALAE